MPLGRIDSIRHQHRSAVLVVTLMGALCLVLTGSGSRCEAQGGRVGDFQITARANPYSVPADGKSTARIYIDVRDTAGRPAPDSTNVVVSTDLGRLGETEFPESAALTVRTTVGRALVFATSHTPGLAKIKISVGASRSEDLLIDFRPEGEEAAPAMRVVNIRGGWVGYSVDLNIVEARDDASLEYGGMTVSGADILQLDVDRMDLRAEPATVARNDKQLEGESLFFQLYTKRGALRQFTDEGSRRVSFDLFSMESRPLDEDLSSEAFDFVDAESHTWLVADSITVFVDEKIVLRHAKMYVDGEKAVSLPSCWVIPMPGYRGASHGQILGVSSDGELSVNFPFFYRVTDTAAGAIEIRRGAQSGSVVAHKGWALGLREEYRSSEIEGEVMLSGLPRGDWGMQWRDTRRVFGGALADLSISSPEHHSLFVDANLFNYRRSYRNNVRGYYSRPEYSDSSYGLAVDWLTSPRRFTQGSNNTFRLGASLGGRHDSWEKSGLVFDNELYGQMDFGAWRLASQTWLRFDIDNVYTWDTAGYGANRARTSLGLEKGFGNSVTAFFDYGLEYGSGDAYRQDWWQVLDLNSWAVLGRWESYLRGSWDLTNDGTLASLDLIYCLNDRWRLAALGTYYKYDDTSFDDIELGLAWRVWQGREIGLRWSRDLGGVTLELGGLSSIY